MPSRGVSSNGLSSIAQSRHGSFFRRFFDDKESDAGMGNVHKIPLH